MGGLRGNIPGVPRRNIGDTGRMSEKKVARSLGGRLTPASGAMDGAKGDIVLEDFLIEAKSTVNESVSIKYSWLGKICTEAMMDTKKPALSVRFVTGDGRAVRDGDWVMLRRTDFEELIGD